MLAHHCRANLLLEKEFYKLRKNPLWGIDAVPLADDSFLKWQAVIRGPKDSVWEGGAFKIFLSFSEEYNFKPPEVFFHTIPFHPNVEMQTGVPCMEFLTNDDHWKESYDIAYILLQLQVMLDNPVLENPVNLEAASMCRKRPLQYKQMALDCVFASRQVEAGLRPQVVSSMMSESKEECGRPSLNYASKKQVSYEEYYKTWVNIATSKPISLLQRPLESDNFDDVMMDEDHFGDLKGELEEELKRQLSDHNSLMYGRFRDKQSKDERRIAELQAAKSKLVKQMYLKEQEQEQLDSIPDTLATTVTFHVDFEDPADDEVDNLVSWTETLPEQLE